MEKRKFTDGEWRFVPEDNGFAVRNDDNEIICTSADPEVMENDANGRLLSAAKDLHIASINALKEIQKVIREGAINRRDLEAAASDLTDAIYKARVGFDWSAQVGRDVPVESMSDVRLSRSRNTQRQKWGRVLRYKDYPALIFDHVGNALPERHGQPSDPQEWRLEGRVGGRKKTRQQIEANRQCTECFHMHATAPVCPNCGHIYPKKKPS